MSRSKYQYFSSLLLALYAMLAALPQSFAQTQSETNVQLNLPRTTLTAGIHQIQVQLALTPEQQQTGLMYRKSMPMAEGMLFVLENRVQCFWMKNTLIPLTAAFIDETGEIVNFANMQPQTTQSHCSQKAVPYVLEMNQGWFTQKGIKVGDRLSGLPQPKK